MRLAVFNFLFFFLLISYPRASEGFAILSHEAVVDVAWDKAILPALRKKFPDQKDSDYMKAKAYAYGGAILPDIGFFPFGSLFYTNLVHYVRSGDFVEELINDAQDLNEYAFALGALAHYFSDNYGHPLGVNVAVAMVYPKDQKKYGDTIPYVKNPMNHRRMEFAFDVLQIARSNYEKDDYNSFFGFRLSKSLVERAFLKTYGIELGSVFGNTDLAFASLRFFVRNLFPPLTKSAWVNKKDDIQKLNPSVSDQNFIYRINHQEFRKEWGKTPIGVGITAWVIWLMPKMIGPARALRFRMPTKEAEQNFNNCFDSVEVHYSKALAQLARGNLQLPNLDFDTGRPSALCEYSLANDAYCKLVTKQKNDHFSKVTPQIRESIMQFYGRTPADSSSMIAVYEALDKEKIVCPQSDHQNGKAKANETK